MLHAVSTLVVAIVAAGVILRRRPAIHLRLMTAAFVIDLGLVLYIEATRHAVERVAGPASPLLWFHAAVSMLVLALYIGQITLGRRLRTGRPVPRRAHFALGLVFCVCRSLNYATAFLVSSQSLAPVPQQAVVDTRPAPALFHESE